MSIESKIREAFSKKKSVDKRVIKWNPETQTHLYALAVFLRKSGYRLLDVLVREGTKELVLEPVTTGYLYPEIVHDTTDGDFYIKVVDHGLLKAPELSAAIQGYENALVVIQHLKSVNLDSLEVEDEK